MGEQLKINNHLSFGMTTFYKGDKQFIIGITINKEEELHNTLYEITPHRVQNKYELNLWLVYIGLHITVRGKSKQI